MNKPSTQTDADIAIVGAGWAGLAAAATLSRHGHKVLLIEAAHTLGGRARRVETPMGDVDNGQHIFIGAYKELLDLIQSLNVPESSLFIRTKLNLSINSLADKPLHISASRLPCPLHLLSGLLMARGLGLSEKGSIIRCWLSMTLSGFSIAQDKPVSTFLAEHKQSPRLIRLFWAPLCIAALNTPIEKASAQIYLNVLRKTFSGSRSNSDFLFARSSLGDVLPTPVCAYIRKQGGQVRNGERLKTIHFDNEQLASIHTSKTSYVVKHLLLATPYHQTHQLLSPFATFSAVCQALASLEHEAITTLYMQFPDTIRLDQYLSGLSDGITQWYVDRRSCGQPGMIAAVISANGKHMAMDKAALTRAIVEETRQVFPTWPPPLSTYLIREKRATFSCKPDMGHVRPKPGHIGRNVWLAGDYLDTDLPATLEGAIVSGVQCAHKILETAQQTQ